MAETKKDNRMGRTGSKPAPIPQPPIVLTFNGHGYKFRKADRVKPVVPAKLVGAA